VRTDARRVHVVLLIVSLVLFGSAPLAAEDLLALDDLEFEPELFGEAPAGVELLAGR